VIHVAIQVPRWWPVTLHSLYLIVIYVQAINPAVRRWLAMPPATLVVILQCAVWTTFNRLDQSLNPNKQLLGYRL
jgi:hypothetical protein